MRISLDRYFKKAERYVLLSNPFNNAYIEERVLVISGEKQINTTYSIAVEAVNTTGNVISVINFRELILVPKLIKEFTEVKNLSDIPFIIDLKQYFDNFDTASTVSIEVKEYGVVVPNDRILIQNGMMTITPYFRNISYEVNIILANDVDSVGTILNVIECHGYDLRYVDEIVFGSTMSFILQYNKTLTIFAGLGKYSGNDNVQPETNITSHVALQLDEITSISCGLNIVYAISNSDLYAWGFNDSIQQYIYPSSNNFIQTPLLIARNMKKVVGGNNFAIAIGNNNALYSWGVNDKGQLGHGNNTKLSVPTLINSGSLYGKFVKDICVGGYHCLALDTSNKLHAWGFNTNCQLGLGDDLNRNIPSLVTTLYNKDVSAIACGEKNSLVLIDGDVYNFGYGTWNPTPVAIASLQVFNIVQISCGYYHSLVLSDDGKVYAWGDDNTYGQIGNNTTASIFSINATTIPIVHVNYGDMVDKKIISIHADYYSSSAVDIYGNLYVWGKNTNGQLGLGDTVNRLVPTMLNTKPIIQFRANAITSEYVLMNNPINNGSYVSFDRTRSQYVAINKVPKWFYGGRGLTVFVVARFTSIVSSEPLFDFGNGGANNNIVFERYNDTSNIRFRILNGSNAFNVILTNGIPDDDEMHLWIVRVKNERLTGFSGFQVELYMDSLSSYVSETFYGIPSMRSTTINYIAKSNYSNVANFNGDIQELLVYDYYMYYEEFENAFNKLYYKWFGVSRIMEFNNKINVDFFPVFNDLIWTPYQNETAYLTLSQADPTIFLWDFSFFQNGNGITALTVARFKSSGLNETLFDFVSETNNFSLSLHRVGTSNDISFKMRRLNEIYNVTFPYGIPDNDFHLWIVRVINNGSNGFTIELYFDDLNNFIETTFSSVMSYQGTYFNHIGNSSVETDDLFDGDIGEILLYSNSFSDNALENIASKLIVKWFDFIILFDQKVTNSSFTAYNTPTVKTFITGLEFTSFTRSLNQYIVYRENIKFFNNNKGATVFVVARFSGVIGTWEKLIDFGQGVISNNNIILSRIGTTNKIQVQIYNSDVITNCEMFHSIPTDGFFHLWIFRIINNGAGGFIIELYLDSLDGKVTTTSTSALVPRKTTVNYIGKNSWNNPLFNGDIGKLVVYPNTLDGNEFISATNDIRSQWKLVSPLLHFDQKVSTGFTSYTSPLVKDYIANGLQYTSFNRSLNQYIAYNNSIQLFENNTGMTAFVVARFTGTPGNWERLFEFTDANNNNDVILCRNLTSNSAYIRINNNASQTYTLTMPNGIPTDGKFHLWIMCVINNGTSGCIIELYLDSLTNKVSTTFSTPLLPRVTVNNYIGSYVGSGDGSVYFSGDIGKVLIYTKTFDETELNVVINVIQSQWKLVSLDVFFDQKVSEQFTAYNIPSVQTNVVNKLEYTSFNRSLNQYIKYNNSVNIFNNGNGLTTFAVARFTLLGNWERIFDFGNGTLNYNTLFGRYGVTNNMFFEIFNSNISVVKLIMTNGIPTDSLFHLWIVRVINKGASGFDVELYLDSLANKVTSTSAVALIPRVTTMNYIGESNWSGDDFFHGDISEISMYNYSMSNEILEGNTKKVIDKWNTKRVMGISVYSAHLRMIYMNTGDLYAFGKRNTNYNFGDNSISEKHIGLTKLFSQQNYVVKAVSNGNANFALLYNGDLYTWGVNTNYCLGAGNDLTIVYKIPTLILTNVVDIHCNIGLLHILACTNDGKVYSWGKNDFGQLGFALSTTFWAVPSLIALGAIVGKKIVKVVAATDSSYAIDNGGKLYAWGSNTNGQTGINSQGYIPVLLNGGSILSTTVIISAQCGGKYMLALDNTGNVHGIGINDNGQLANGATNNSTNTPTYVKTSSTDNLSNIIYICANDGCNSAVDSSGKVYVWGVTNRQIFDNAAKAVGKYVYATELLIPSGIVKGKIVGIEVGETAYIWDDLGIVYGWGSNANNALLLYDTIITVPINQMVYILPNFTNVVPVVNFDQKVTDLNFTSYNVPIVNRFITGREYTTFNSSLNQYVTCNNGISFFDNNEGMTVFFVARFTGNWERLFDFGNGTSIDNIFLARNSTPSGMQFVIFNSDQEVVQLINTNDIPTDNFFHLWIVRVINNGAIGCIVELYLDSLSNKVSATSTIELVQRTVNINYIGKSNRPDNALFNGDIAQVVIYNSTIDDITLSSNITNLMNIWVPVPVIKTDLSTVTTASELTNVAYSLNLTDYFDYIGTIAIEVTESGVVIENDRVFITNNVLTIIPKYRNTSYEVTVTVTYRDSVFSTLTVTEMNNVIEFNQSINLSTGFEAFGNTPPTIVDYINGLNTLKYTSFNRSLNQYIKYNKSAKLFYDNNGLTIFVVARFTSAGNSERIFDFGNGSANNNILLARNSTTNTIVFTIFNSTDIVTQHVMTNAIPTDSLFHLWIVRVINNGASGFDVELYLDYLTNKVTSKSTVALIPRVTTMNYIGESNWSNDAFFNGDIGKVLIYGETLNDLSSIITELATIWVPNPVIKTDLSTVTTASTLTNTLYSLDLETYFNYIGTISIVTAIGTTTITDGRAYLSGNTLYIDPKYRNQTYTVNVIVSNARSSVSSILNVTESDIFPGLSYKIYAGYFADTVSWFIGKTPSKSGVATSFNNIALSTNNTLNIYTNVSIEWTGYFYARKNGTHTFSMQSDDGSFLWIGNNAISGYTKLNANIQNGGIHGMIMLSTTYSMTSGTMYPIRIQYGQNSSGYGFNFGVKPPLSTVTLYNLLTYVYYYNIVNIETLDTFSNASTKISNKGFTLLATPTSLIVADSLPIVTTFSSFGQISKNNLTTIFKNNTLYGAFFLENKIQFTIEWKFTDDTNSLNSLFTKANTTNYGASYTFKVYNSSGIVFDSISTAPGERKWCFSNNMLYDSSKSVLSNDDGIWGAAKGINNLDGNSPGPDLAYNNGGWGIQNYNGGDGNYGLFSGGTIHVSGTINALIYC